MAFDPNQYLADNSESAFDPDAYLSGVGSEARAAEGLKVALPYIQKAMDYTDGITRAVLVSANDPGSKGHGKAIDRFNEQQLKPLRDEMRTKAAKGNAPSYGELFSRAGIPLAGPAGFIADTTTSFPYLGTAVRIASPAGKLGRIAKVATAPTSEATTALSKWGHKNAFKALDVEAMKAGKQIMPSKVLVDNDVAAWTARGINDQMSSVAEELLNARNKILSAATDAGGKINNNIAEKYARELAAKYRAMGTDQTDAIANAIENELSGLQRLRPAPPIPPKVETTLVQSSLLDQSGNPFTKEVSRTIPGVPARPGTSPSRATDIKTFFAKQVPSQNWSPYVQTPLNAEMDKALATGLKEATEDSVSKTLGVQKGAKLENLNQKLGSLLSTRKKEVGEVGKEEMRNLFTSVDGMLLGASGAMGMDPRWFLIKKAADFAKMQGPRSMAGKYGTKLGQSLLPDAAIRQGTVWSLRNRGDEK